MEALSYWKQKVVQFFHDPPGKPFVLYPGAGGHNKVAGDLFEKLTRLPLKGYNRRPDWAASGADRAVLPPGDNWMWVKAPWITHPLAKGGAWFDVRPPGVQELDKKIVQAEAVQAPEELLAPSDEDEAPLVELEWQDLASLQRGYLILWRRFREALLGRDGHLGLIWGEMPADTRQPDHSIWDHGRMTTALAFLSGSKKALDPRHPWLMRLALSPVQRFILQARTSRDLWTGSFLLADLAWHAMAPIVEVLGPDAILYPDLRGNPLVDHFMLQQRLYGVQKEDLVGDGDSPASFAALLPASFVALVPRGGEGDLPDLEELGRQCVASVEQRWQKLAEEVEQWLIQQVGHGSWQTIWKRQFQRHPVTLHWTAQPWPKSEPLQSASSLEGGPALLFEKEPLWQPPEADRQAMQKRAARYRPWLPDATWRHYQQARLVFARTRLSYLNSERGFDYSLAHAQLLARHAMLKQQPADNLLEDAGEPGEKCTQCGQRQALTNASENDPFTQQRHETRQFWKNEKLDPEGLGAERLCGPCALKRFLVPAGRKGDQPSGINTAWAGSGTPVKALYPDGKVRVPFPSTATMAAQSFIEQVLNNEALRPQVQAVVEAHQKARLTPTTFPNALPRLAALARAFPSGVAHEFLIREAEETLFPEAVEAMADQPGLEPQRVEQLRKLARAIEQLRQAARRADIAPPDSRFAVLKLDGDRMGRLIGGDPEAMGARWKEVLHPKFLQRLVEQDCKHHWGWIDLLERPRHMGPSLHAFITRALAEFQHRVVPWVVEREFSGRLIYSGGDDVLCLVPADEALDLAARLQQLFSAPWILDTAPDKTLWEWRLPGNAVTHDPDRDRTRFVVLGSGGSEAPLRAPFPDQVQPHAADGLEPPVPDSGYRLVPMLGNGHNLSAGIAFGHYKTPLSVMLAEAGRLLDHWAKERAGRGAVAVGHVTRGGVKNRFAMNWDRGAHEHLNGTIQGFGPGGGLPGRLPYRLRELSPALGVLQGEAREALARALFRRALGDRAPDSRAARAALAVWLHGVALHGTEFEAEAAVQGLLVCRALAAGGGEERT